MTQKQTSSEKGTKDSSVAEKQPRRYFEVFGDVLSENAFLKNALAGLICLCILIGVILLKAVNRPPLIIRMDNIGQPTIIKGWKNQTAITAPEVKNFTRIFLRGFLAWNVYTYDDNFTEVFKMMTPDCQKTLDDYLKTNGIVETIKAEKFNTKLTLSKIEITEDTANVLVVKIKGVRLVTSFEKSDYMKEIVFEDTLTIAKVERSETAPWGMLVDNWKEELFKAQ